MKKLIFFIAMLFALTSISVTSFGQKRPVRKTTAPVSKPKVTETPPEVETAPVKKTVVEVTSAQGFFNQGLKCEAKDYDCQISNYTKAINLNLNTKDVFKNRGNAFLQRKDFDKAIADFTKLIELDLNDASGYKNRGRIFLENSNSPQAVNAAIRDFTSAIDLEPKDIEAYKLRSSAYLKLRSYDKAKADMDKISAIEPNNVDVVIIQGEMFLAAKQFDKAIESFNKAIAAKPIPSAYLSRGNAYASLKKYDLALADFSKAIELEPRNAEIYFSRGQIFENNKKLDKAINDYTKAIELDSKHVASYEKRGGIYLSKKKYDKAIADASRAIEIDPERYLPYSIRGSADYISSNYKSDVQYKKDIEIYKSLFLKNTNKEVEANPQSAEAYLNRGSAFATNGQYDLAIKDYSRAIELNPQNSQAYAIRGATITGIDPQGKAIFRPIDLAIKDINTAIELEPNNADWYYFRGSRYFFEKQCGLAIKDLSKVIELDPSSISPYSIGSYSLLATIYENYEKKLDLAISSYSKLIDSGNSGFYSLRARLYEEKKQFELACRDYGLAFETSQTASYLESQAGCLVKAGQIVSAFKALAKLHELQPPSPDVRFSGDGYDKYSYLLFMSKDADPSYLERAVADLTKAIEQDPQNANNFFFLATAIYSVGEYKEAIALYSKCSELNSMYKQYCLNMVANEPKAEKDRIATKEMNAFDEKRRKKQERNKKLLQIMGAVNTGLETFNNARQASSTSQPNTPSRPQTTQSGELSNGGTVSAQKNWGQWSTSSCNSDIQFSVINDGPVPGDNTLTYWRIRARSRNGKQASLEVFYGESQAEISYAIANRNANARGESRSVIGVAYLESDRIKTNFPQVDIRNNSTIFVRIASIGWMDSGGRIVETVRCDGR